MEKRELSEFKKSAAEIADGYSALIAENANLRRENDDLRLLLNYLRVTVIDAPVTDETGKGVMAMGGIWQKIDEDSYEDVKRIVEKYSDEGEAMFEKAKLRRF